MQGFEIRSGEIAQFVLVVRVRNANVELPVGFESVDILTGLATVVVRL